MRYGGSSDGASASRTVAAQETRWRQRDDRHGPTADIALGRHVDPICEAIYPLTSLERAVISLTISAGLCVAVGVSPAAGAAGACAG